MQFENLIIATKEKEKMHENQTKNRVKEEEKENMFNKSFIFLKSLRKDKNLFLGKNPMDNLIFVRVETIFKVITGHTYDYIRF